MDTILLNNIRRRLVRNKLTTFINIAGLTMGITVSALLFKYVWFEFSYENFLPHKENLYRIGYNLFENGNLSLATARTFSALGIAVKNNLPEVKNMARIWKPYIESTVTYENIHFVENNIFFADSTFLDIFDFPLKGGSRIEFSESSRCVLISESIAYKYFRDEDPLGKIISIDDTALTVTGVFYDVPENSHLKFDFLTPINNGPVGNDDSNWDGAHVYTYISLNQNANPGETEKKINNLARENKEPDQSKQERFFLQPVSSIHLKSHLAKEIKVNGDIQRVYLAMIIAVLIILVAMANFINQTTVLTADRSREIAIRKIMGGSSMHLIRQVFLETLILAFIAGSLSLYLLVLAEPYIHLYIFNEISLFANDQIYLIILFSVIFIGFIAGIYPALLLKSISPVEGMKERVNKLLGKNALRKGLTTLQFIISLCLIIGTIFIYRQMQFMRSFDLGFTPDQILVLKESGFVGDEKGYHSKYLVFREKLLQNPDIRDITGSSIVPGKENPFNFTNLVRTASEKSNESKTFKMTFIDFDFIPTYQLELIKGRNFSRDFVSDNKNLILNQAAVSALGFRNAGEAISSDGIYIDGFWAEGIRFNIIGVIKDFHQESLKKNIEPTIFYLNENVFQVYYYSVKVNPGHINKTIQYIKSQWSTVFPDKPFDYFFLDDFFNRQYQQEYKFRRIFLVFSILTILVACLGVFNISAFNLKKRKKEIGIRKVIGASPVSLFILTVKGLSGMLLLASLIAWPVSYYVINSWLENYAVHIHINFGFFLLASGMLIFITLLTISYHAIKSIHIGIVSVLQEE